MWMDHHCNFTGQCVGFKNIRCFLLMQLYTQLLLYLLAPLAVRRLWLEPLPWTDAWSAAKLIAFAAAWVKLRRLVRYFLSAVLGKIGRGWPSLVLLSKFQGVVQYASCVEKQACGRIAATCSATASVGLSRLQLAIAQVHGPNNTLRGIFAATDFWSSVANVFGEPRSWRWLNPLLVGGSGDPLAPVLYDAKACEAWASLGSCLEDQCSAAVAQIREQDKMAANAARKEREARHAWSERVTAMLANAQKATEGASATVTEGCGVETP